YYQQKLKLPTLVHKAQGSGVMMAEIKENDVTGAATYPVGRISFTLDLRAGNIDNLCKPYHKLSFYCR
ncbi:MAG: hypothetical protein NT075_28530, partial [Chloroflexi bacterium]|nr:hypothetical protein [Chloroflexota bacterium]